MFELETENDYPFEWKDHQYNPAPEEKEFLEEYFKRYKIQTKEDMSVESPKKKERLL